MAAKRCTHRFATKLACGPDNRDQCLAMPPATMRHEVGPDGESQGAVWDRTLKWFLAGVCPEMLHQLGSLRVRGVPPAATPVTPQLPGVTIETAGGGGVRQNPPRVVSNVGEVLFPNVRRIYQTNKQSGQLYSLDDVIPS